MRQEGQVDSQGVITTDPEGALARLSERLLPEPEMYLLKAVQALVAGGGNPITIRQKIAWVEVEAPTPMVPPDLDPQDWVAQAWRSEVPAIRHLATALVGGWRLFEEIHVDWGTLRWRLVPGEGTEPQELTSRGSRGHARLEFKRKQWKLFNETPPFFDRLFACPIPLRSPWMPGMWQVRAYSGVRNFPRPNTEIISALAAAAPHDWSAPLMVPDLVRGYPVFFTPEKSATALAETRSKNDGMAAHWYHATRYYLLLDADEPSVLIPVDSGVALDPIMIDIGVNGLYCVVSVQREGLKTDLSQFRLLNDAAFQRLLGELRAEARGVLELMALRLETWKPQGRLETHTTHAVGGFLAGGVLGFGLIAATGLMLPFHFLALPGGMLGAYYGGKHWRKRALKRLREQSERLG